MVNFCLDCGKIIISKQAIRCGSCACKTRIGKNNSMYGKHHSEETKRLMSLSKIGLKMPPRTQEYRDNVSKRMKGKPKSKESIEKMKETKKRLFKEGKIKVWNKGLNKEEDIRVRRNGINSSKTKKKLFKNKDYKEKFLENNSGCFQKGMIPWSKGKYLEYLRGENNHNWRGGICNEPYSFEFNKELKKYIRSKYNYRCAECGYSEKQLEYTLHIHHIDYNKKNYKEDNLMPLCRSCHSKTGFKRDDWTKYFQEKIGEIL